MKKLFTLILLCSTTLTFAQTSKAEVAKIIKEQSDGIKGQSSDTTNLTIKEVYNDVKSAGPEVKDLLKEVAKALKITVNQLWDILVKQQLVWSIAYLLCIILTLFSWIHFYYRIDQGNKKASSNDSYRSYWKDSDVVICIVCGIIALTGTILSVMRFQAMLTGFINPEYGAIQTILETANNLQQFNN